MHDPRIDQLADIAARPQLPHQDAARRCSSRRSTCRSRRSFAGSSKARPSAARVPLVSWKSNAVLRSLYQTATEESMKLAGQFESARMEQVQAYIGIRGAANSSQFADVPQEKMDLYQQHWWKTVHTDVRIAKTKWVVLRYPTDSFAQAANMSTPAFEDFYFDVCTADYAAMKEAQEPLAERMRKADRVRIVAPGTELEFSIKDIPVIPCWGERNIPDGEVFTAPVRDSINGRIRFNTQSRYQGTRVRQHRVRVQGRQDRARDGQRDRRRSTRFSIPTKAPATAASGRSA